MGALGDIVLPWVREHREVPARWPHRPHCVGPRSADPSGTLTANASALTEHDDVRWWAGVATVLPHASLCPPRGSGLVRRWNEYRLGGGGRPIFRYPRIPREQARRLARPTSSGFGDLLCAWMMPMTLSEMNGWRLHIPVPANAGGLHHDPSRPQITPEWLHATLALPASVRMVATESAPEDDEWFCTLEQQWHLNGCMETSYDTIPWWLRGNVDRSEYYDAYQRVARGLVRTPASVFGDGRPYCALNARRADRGRPGDDKALGEIMSALTSYCRDWAVVSDSPETASILRSLLRAEGCTVAEPPSVTPVGRTADDGADRRARLMQSFTTLVGARTVVCSVRGGWSAFPYAATRLSGAPLVFTEALDHSIVWARYTSAQQRTGPRRSSRSCRNRRVPAPRGRCLG